MERLKHGCTSRLSLMVPLPDLRFQFFAYTYRRSLFVRIEDGHYKVFRHQGHNLFRPASTSPTRSYSQLPPRARPAEVQASFLHSKWKLLGTPSPHLRHSFIPPSATATFDLYVNTLEPWEIDLLRQVTLEVDPYSLCLELTPGFRAVSDGSAKFQTNGSFGWVVSTLMDNALHMEWAQREDALSTLIEQRHMDSCLS
ncbi:hypothetical protein MHU86_15302 [Fragilaria crotonensis]|nr:hypothetical protein MHU86_15302 [Fragilaria crotonensis]